MAAGTRASPPPPPPLRLPLLLALLAAAAPRRAAAALPAPLPLVCLATTQRGCYNDSWTRVFPVGPLDAFDDNGTLETCAFLCATQPAPGPYPIAAIEDGGQCFCADEAALARAQPNRTADALCGTPCNGFPLSTCGGQWHAQAYEFECEAYAPGAMPWQNSSLPIASRVDDLIARLSDLQLIAQLTQNGADVYARGVQLPRYIVSQECLAGYDGGDIYIAPPVQHTASSGFPQPVNMGNSFDAELVREVASAISDEARAAFHHLGRPSLTCMSPNLNVARDPRWGEHAHPPSHSAHPGAPALTPCFRADCNRPAHKPNLQAATSSPSARIRRSSRRLEPPTLTASSADCRTTPPQPPAGTSRSWPFRST